MRAIVVGAGIMGLSIAYNLAIRGAEVVVLESRYPGSGLSVRAIGALHTQWNNEHDIELAKHNRDILQRLSGVLNFNIPFRQDGYLALATDEVQLTDLKKYAKLQKSMGIDTTILTPEEIARRYPNVETKAIVGGSLSKGDGSVHPFSLVFGYWTGLKDHGGKLVRPTLVKGLHPKGTALYAVETDQGIHEADAIILSAGVGTRSILQSVGLDVPTEIVRHEMLATEPLKFFLKPMIELFPNRLYITQSLRGEILCHIPRHDPDPKDTKSTLEFLEDAATELTQILPTLRAAKVLRSWAGLVETTPDSEPICGKIGFDNLWIALGDSGKGLMFAPLIGELLSEEILTGEKNPDLLRYSPNQEVKQTSLS
jgi:sarcosine oxidase subunit beta